MKTKINIKGNDNVFLVDKMQGDAIAEQWFKWRQAKPSERHKFNAPLKLDGYIGDIASIRSFEDVKQTRAEQAQKTNTDHEGQFRAETMKIRNMDLEKRAKRVEEYKTVYWALTGEYPSDEKCLEVARRQYVFFRDNPKRTVADVDIWQLPEPKQTTVNSFLNVKGRSSVITLIGSLIAHDRRAAKYE